MSSEMSIVPYCELLAAGEEAAAAVPRQTVAADLKLQFHGCIIALKLAEHLRQGRFKSNGLCWVGR